MPAELSELRLDLRKRGARRTLLSAEQFDLTQKPGSPLGKQSEGRRERLEPVRTRRVGAAKSGSAMG